MRIEEEIGLHREIWIKEPSIDDAYRIYQTEGGFGVDSVKGFDYPHTLKTISAALKIARQEVKMYWERRGLPNPKGW